MFVNKPRLKRAIIALVITAFLLLSIQYALNLFNKESEVVYVPKEEVEEGRAGHDPIEALRNLMLKEAVITEDALKLIEREIKDIVNDAADFSQTSPEPDPSELWTDVLKE